MNRSYKQESFNEKYPEFGRDKTIEESLKKCPSCNVLFNMWRKEKTKSDTRCRGLRVKRRLEENE